MENQYVSPAESVMAVKEWVITLIIVAIPLVGFIMLFVWAFGSDVNLQKQNFAKAAIIVYGIIFLLTMIFMLFFGGLMALFSPSNFK